MVDGRSHRVGHLSGRLELVGRTRTTQFRSPTATHAHPYRGLLLLLLLLRLQLLLQTLLLKSELLGVLRLRVEKPYVMDGQVQDVEGDLGRRDLEELSHGEDDFDEEAISASDVLLLGVGLAISDGLMSVVCPVGQHFGCEGNVVVETEASEDAQYAILLEADEGHDLGDNFRLALTRVAAVCGG